VSEAVRPPPYRVRECRQIEGQSRTSEIGIGRAVRVIARPCCSVVEGRMCPSGVWRGRRPGRVGVEPRTAAKTGTRL